MSGIVEIVELSRRMISGELQREVDRKCFLIVERILAATVNAPNSLSSQQQTGGFACSLIFHFQSVCMKVTILCL